MPAWATPRRAFSSRPRIRWAAGFWAPGRWAIIRRRPKSYLGGGKWGAGPTIVALQQEHGFTYGILANQIWSFAGQQNRQNINSTFLQPFVSFTTKTYTTFAVNTETTYDWQADQATVPMNFMVQQLVKIGKQPIAFQVGYRYYVEKPDGGPDWGLRFTITFLFPKNSPKY